MKNSGQPVLFIDITETKDELNNKNYQFNITPEAIQLLQQIGDRNIAVLVIAGPQRTGKSFLANRFLKQMDGFAIGPSTNPCTKGIWVWNKPVKLNETTDMIILDTEGLNSIQRDLTIDMKIFSISVLLASMFIYNNLGHIDESAIENLSLVVRLSENICIQKMSDGDAKLGEFFPSFYWILRDFSLDLRGITPKAYLENCLKPLPGNTSEIIKKNEIRDKFRQYFQIRDCEALVRPLDEEHKLARIEKQPWNSLRPAFIEGVTNIEKKVFQGIKAKSIMNKTLTGKMLMGLVMEYLQAINTGGIPNIMNSLEAVVSSQVRREHEEARSQYLQNVSQAFSPEKLPIDEEILIEQHRVIVDNVFSEMQKRSKSFIDAEQLIEIRKDLQELINTEFNIKIQQNKELSLNSCKNVLLKFMNQFSLPNIQNPDQINVSFQEKIDDFQRFLKNYLINQKGNGKYKVFSEVFPGFIFGYFKQCFEKMNSVYNEEVNRNKVKVKQVNEQAELLRNSIKEYERLTLDLQREIEQQKSQLEKLSRENSKTKMFQEQDDKSSFGQIEQLQLQIKNKKEKNKQLKQENLEASENLYKVRSELNQKKKEIQGLKSEIDELKKLTNNSTGLGNDQEIQEVITAVRNLKNQITFMDNFFSTRNSIESSYASSQDTQIKEYEQFRMEKQKIIQDYKNKLDLYKQQNEQERERNVRKIATQNKYMEELKIKNMELTEQNQELTKKSIQLKELIKENEKLRENNSIKQQNLDTLQLVFQEQQKQLEKNSNLKLDLENKLAFMKSEQFQLVSFKESFPYLLRESLKYILNRNSKLKHSLKTLNEEDIQQVKECFLEVGVELNL
ncbi:hypothetical protein IMG5_179190 [Ichthyophthirius multifiliis]|uniref:GB1/RHD3-type G domain-containing protein n=1 Tax=Ichthyophthirius multifiliis TaxID=5932 RepID=G0R2K8_ICHMU|nr:hypothetical protein IMG5_179190 [Ichthyophthirius multifiliis]EGR28299.1 hypothetical protein IMG5_179190 [Ichthyophthirius multifiliis]|eukprot:XP_004027644.1 hypothetical protein IMG5_179190 [Ichthyophthirius multifiliis]